MTFSIATTEPQILPVHVGAGIDVWRVELDQVEFGDEQLSALSAAERRRANQLYFERDRRWFVRRRFALRVILADYLDLRPSEVSLGAGPTGKPFVTTDRADLRFSCSHSSGLTLFAIGVGADVGVDVERVRSLPELDDLARLQFAEDEWRELGRMPESPRQRQFFRLWTAKEAVLKATGDGLSRRLDSVRLYSAHGVDSRSARIEGDGSRHWSTTWFSPAPDYVACVATEISQ
jgi:4'-phosphopantetheinyl transferase